MKLNRLVAIRQGSCLKACADLGAGWASTLLHNVNCSRAVRVDYEFSGAVFPSDSEGHEHR